MALIPWRRKRREGELAWPETSLARLRDEIERLFDRFWEDAFELEPLEPLTKFWPAMDVSENDEAVTVKLELPGVDPKDVSIEVTGDILTIRGEKKQESEEKGKDFHRLERRYGAFQRSVRLPSSVDTQKVEATYKNGVLTITLPKREGAKRKRIEVKAG